MSEITYEMLVEWRACYLRDERADLLRRLFASPVPIRDVLTRQDGEWASIPAEDRIWVATRPGVLSDRVLRLIACDIAERALLAERAAGREPDARSWAAVEVSRRFASGEATATELAADRAAVWAAAQAAARAAVWAAAQAAARAADRAAASAAVWAADWAADRAAAQAAARAADRAAASAADRAADRAAVWAANVGAFLFQIDDAAKGGA